MYESSPYIALYKLLSAGESLRGISRITGVNLATLSRLKNSMRERNIRVSEDAAERLCTYAEKVEKRAEEERAFFEEAFAAEAKKKEAELAREAREKEEERKFFEGVAL